jgi:phosphohistidine swiveling domain-containing protein
MIEDRRIPRVVADSTVALDLAGSLGGKAFNLARLEGSGLPVPPWYAITAQGFADALGEAGRGQIEQILATLTAQSNPEAVRAAAREMQAFVESLALPPALAAEIDRAHAVRIPDGAEVAVRSSALDEDAAADSFAGIHESFLFVRGGDGVLAAVRRVWASAFAERALAYRLARGIPLAGIAVAVVVQEMVDAAVSGVMFTADPVSGSIYHLTVSALYGAGEGLVSAGFDADTYTVDKETLEIERRLAAKGEQMVRDRAAGGGVVRETVPAERAAASVLEDGQLATLARFGADLERRFGRPQDVEFSFDAEGRLFFLQARPITTLAEDGPAAGNPLVWDNSNIIESYSGVTSPMTFSFIRHAYSIVYHCFAEVMGIDPRVVKANRHVFTHMLGLLRGRVYYNLLNWYRLVGLFPGFSFNKAAMESMMGVRRTTALAALEGEAAPRSFRQRWFQDLPALVRLGLRSARNFLHIRKIVGDFEALFRGCYGRWSALDFRALPPHELLVLYREMEEKLLWEWKAPIVNDFFVMVFYGSLKKLCVSWCGDTAGSLQNDLICGEGGIESTEPTKTLLRLAASIRRDPELSAWFAAREAADLAREVPADPRRAALAAEIARFLDLYGFRSPDELKLEEPTLRDRPDFVYQIVKNYLAMSDPAGLDVAAMDAREQAIRQAAEGRAFRALGERRGLLPRKAIFRRVLANARLGVKNRENLRFSRTRIYGLLREILRAVGEQWAAAGLLERADDIFFLQLFEVWDFVEGMAVTTDLKGLVALRRREFEAYRQGEAPADRVDTWGMVYHRNALRGRPRAAAARADGALSGIGCCPGEVEAEVIVLRSPTEGAELHGQILAAERTDPGWIPLYPAVSGLLIERGSILSHSAIVAREMGIPTIVGIDGLVAALAAVGSGQRVRMNGGTGVVELVAAAGNEPGPR